VELFAFLVMVLLEILTDLPFAWLFDLLEGASRRRSGRPRTRIVLPALLFLLLGGAVGLVLAVVLPGRLLPRGPMPGASLVFAPLACGVAMHAYGEWRRRRGAEPTVAASFLGGAAFAFGASLVRFLMVR
jgi:hypothetical protein